MPSGTPWTREGFLEHVSGLFVEAGRPLTSRELRTKGISETSARTLFGSWGAAKKRVWELAQGTMMAQKELEGEFDKKKGVPAKDWRKIVAHAKKTQSLMAAEKGLRTKATVELPDRMCAVVFSSDVHFGSVACDMGAWEEDTKFILNTPDVYLMTLGDEADNFVTFRSLEPIFQQVIPPVLQKKVITGYLTELARANKLKAAWWGNHTEEFEERLMGYSYYKELKESLCPFFAGQGMVDLRVGEQQYSVLGTHGSRFSSFYHALHSAKRVYQLTFPADVVVTAHHHRPAYELYSHYELAREWGYDFGGFSYLVRCGSYKREDAYSIRYFGPGVLGTPTVVFFPDRHEMAIFLTAQRAVDFMRGVKGR